MIIKMSKTHIIALALEIKRFVMADYDKDNYSEFLKLKIFNFNKNTTKQITSPSTYPIYNT